MTKTSLNTMTQMGQSILGDKVIEIQKAPTQNYIAIHPTFNKLMNSSLMKKEFVPTYAILKKYEPLYPEELIAKEKMLDFLVTREDCFLRSCTVGHFTASAFLLNKDKTQVCLMYHAKLDKWVQLGGHCDGDYAILNVAIREAKEESGIQNIKPLHEDIFDIDIHWIPPTSKDEAHYHFDIRFLLHAYDDNTLIKNHESKDLRWAGKHDKHIPHNLLRMFKKWREMRV